MPEAPATVGRYRIERLIAHGGMGSLYLARDPVIDRPVAIKLLREGFDDAAARERFAREARSAGRLHHPNIVTVFDVGEYHDRPFIAMEYVEGETLAELIRRRAIVWLWQKLVILEEICAALHYAHSAAIVHRDIKPANVMLDESGLVKILDFGIARAEGIEITRVGDVFGTLNYMSPEQLTGATVDHRTDIYSVGVLAYELVTSQMAFPGTPQTGVLHRILNAGPPPMDTLVPGIDADIAATIERAMAKAPDARYQDLESLRQDLVVVHTRLLAASVDTDAGADPEAETRFCPGDTAAATHPRSSARVRLTPPRSTTGSAVGSGAQVAPQVAPPRRRNIFVLGGMTIAILSVALAVWIITQPRVERSPVPLETAAPSAPSAQSSAQPSAAAPSPGSIETRPQNDRADLEEQLRAVRATARRQLAAGDRQRALATIKSGLTLDPKDPEINALVEEMSRVARRTAAQERSAAGRRGRASAAFADAQARERQGESLMRSGDRVAAIEAFWDASSQYNQVSDTAGQQVSAAPTVAPATPAAGSTELPAALPGNPPISTAPPLPPAPARSPAEKPVPAPTPPKEEETRREPPPDPDAAEVPAVRDTLRRYTQAYQSLRSEAVGQVMPSLTPDQLRSLERDFSNYRSYTVEIKNERIAVDGAAATVACQVVRSFETRSGISQTHVVESVFHLRRRAGVWTIERLESR